MSFTSSGGRTELVWKHDIRLGCKALRLKAKDADQIGYCQLGKLAVEGLEPQQSTCGLSIRTATGQWGLQHLHRVLAFVEGGDGVDVQIHTKSLAELIGDELRIDTGLTRKTGVRASDDLKRRPFELDGFQPQTPRTEHGENDLHYR